MRTGSLLETSTYGIYRGEATIEFTTGFMKDPSKYVDALYNVEPLNALLKEQSGVSFPLNSLIALIMDKDTLQTSLVQKFSTVTIGAIHPVYMMGKVCHSILFTYNTAQSLEVFSYVATAFNANITLKGYAGQSLQTQRFFPVSGLHVQPTVDSGSIKYTAKVYAYADSETMSKFQRVNLVTYSPREVWRQCAQELFAKAGIVVSAENPMFIESAESRDDAYYYEMFWYSTEGEDSCLKQLQQLCNVYDGFCELFLRRPNGSKRKYTLTPDISEEQNEKISCSSFRVKGHRTQTDAIEIPVQTVERKRPTSWRRTLQSALIFIEGPHSTLGNLWTRLEYIKFYNAYGRVARKAENVGGFGWGDDTPLTYIGGIFTPSTEAEGFFPNVLVENHQGGCLGNKVQSILITVGFSDVDDLLTVNAAIADALNTSTYLEVYSKDNTTPMLHVTAEPRKSLDGKSLTWTLIESRPEDLMRYSKFRSGDFKLANPNDIRLNLMMNATARVTSHSDERFLNKLSDSLLTLDDALMKSYGEFSPLGRSTPMFGMYFARMDALILSSDDYTDEFRVGWFSEIDDLRWVQTMAELAKYFNSKAEFIPNGMSGISAHSYDPDDVFEEIAHPVPEGYKMVNNQGLSAEINKDIEFVSDSYAGVWEAVHAVLGFRTAYSMWLYAEEHEIGYHALRNMFICACRSYKNITALTNCEEYCRKVELDKNTSDIMGDICAMLEDTMFPDVGVRKTVRTPEEHTYTMDTLTPDVVRNVFTCCYLSARELHLVDVCYPGPPSSWANIKYKKPANDDGIDVTNMSPRDLYKRIKT